MKVLTVLDMYSMRLRSEGCVLVLDVAEETYLRFSSYVAAVKFADTIKQFTQLHEVMNK